MVVAQQVEWLLPMQEVRSSHPVVDKFCDRFAKNYYILKGIIALVLFDSIRLSTFFQPSIGYTLIFAKMFSKLELSIHLFAKQIEPDYSCISLFT